MLVISYSVYVLILGKSITRLIIQDLFLKWRIADRGQPNHASLCTVSLTRAHYEFDETSQTVKAIYIIIGFMIPVSYSLHSILNLKNTHRLYSTPN